MAVRALHIPQASRSSLGRDRTPPGVPNRCYGPITGTRAHTEEIQMFKLKTRPASLGRALVLALITGLVLALPVTSSGADSWTSTRSWSTWRERDRLPGDREAPALRTSSRSRSRSTSSRPTSTSSRALSSARVLRAAEGTGQQPAPQRRGDRLPRQRKRKRADPVRGRRLACDQVAVYLNQNPGSFVGACPARTAAATPAARRGHRPAQRRRHGLPCHRQRQRPGHRAAQPRRRSGRGVPEPEPRLVHRHLPRARAAR